MHQVGYLQRLYRDARSTEHKIPSIFYHLERFPSLSDILGLQRLWLKRCAPFHRVWTDMLTHSKIVVIVMRLKFSELRSSRGQEWLLGFC